jgi:uncharacterized lipoprotein YddW (UPF0748 family)
MNILKYILSLFIAFILTFNIVSAQIPPKREFRGTWIHTVGQDKYARMSEAEMKSYFISLLDHLHKAGVNAVIFQVRPEADAWYASPYEPWSRFITGIQGKDPGWDPLDFMVKECHKRNMDIHAWINPYRVSSSPSRLLSPDHIYFKHPEWFIKYGNTVMFDPGNPECRKFIIQVVKDLVKRYDIDAIHMDDYFYPYPIAGKDFDDSKSFNAYAGQDGFNSHQKADWRRNNVNILIKELHLTIRKTKPWVKFGISPFGIYRNQKNDPKGSNTNGLSCYDDLYADVLYWVKEGWIDYNMPQLYWNIGNKKADYEVLVDWWSKNNFNKPLYIGQDVIRTIKPDSLKFGQLYRKMMLAEKNSKISGNCFWPGYELEKNAGGIADSLQNNYYKYLALLPADCAVDQIPPKPVRNIVYKKDKDNRRIISWNAPFAHQEMDKAAYYVVYQFNHISDVNLNDPRNIVSIGRETEYILPEKVTGRKIYVVTAVDRDHNESRGTSVRVPK